MCKGKGKEQREGKISHKNGKVQDKEAIAHKYRGNKKSDFYKYQDIILVVYNILSEMAHFVATTERTLANELVRLFRNIMQKLYELPERVILNRKLQFVAELTKKCHKLY